MDINERIAKLQAELDALKAEAAKPAPKYKVGDTVGITGKVSKTDYDDREFPYFVKFSNKDLDDWFRECELLPSAPRLVQADPAKLKPGDEVWIKARFDRVDDDFDIKFFSDCSTRTGDYAGYSIETNVYRLEPQE